MKKYIFLVKGIEDLTGAPRYVNNKCRWLKEQGWQVDVFWSYNVSHAQLEHLIPFDKKEYVIHELLFYPCWFTKHQQNRVINKIIHQVGQAEQIVIESNQLQLGAWGELLAQKLKAKHINFVTTEKIKIHNKATFDFCYAKLKRNEFFTINISAVQYLFSDFLKLENPEEYYWSASPGVEVKKYAFTDFDELPPADFTITSFGRTKAYFPYMLEELNIFISQHPGAKFNVFFLGDLSNIKEIRNRLQLENVHLVIHPEAVEVVPLQIFTKSDVVIATAGCAAIAERYGGKVLSMDVNRNMPLGLLKYTTLDRNTYSGKYDNRLSLSEWLKTLLIDRTIFQKMDDNSVAHSFDYQMKYITPLDGLYLDPTQVNERITKRDKLWIFLSKIGLFKLVDYLYFTKRGGVVH